MEQGGEKRIEVRDNGNGIHHDDLILALDRHATSKITSTHDLAAIQTLGFRGEALASISSVSRLTLDSRHQESDSGWKIFSDGHSTFLKEPSPHLIGTSVIIRDLFYNTPARKKFLKNERVEFSHIEHLVKRIALSHPNVGFRLYHNHRNILDLTPAATIIDKEKRIAAVCGLEFLKHAFFSRYCTSRSTVMGLDS
ncbi:MAG: DNA mismatch repair endonuclease MutL [Gammaproteobacteria bacterium]|nr:DNA mismatch repair endonuclease MutL [Gammaproteobacteria bacterium]